MYITRYFKLFLNVTIILMFLGNTFEPLTYSLDITDQETVVGVTYYGGHYDEQQASWVVDNVNQCSRIAAGEFTAGSLNVVVSPNCDDDNGLGYIGGIPLHNTVSFAELSNDPANPDYAALGKLSSGTKLQIQYGGSCLIAEKRDVGQGGPAVYGQLRALDLWWQTARSLGFTNGFDKMSLRVVDASTSLTPLGATSACMGYAASPVYIPPAKATPAPKPAKKVASPPPAPVVTPEPVAEIVPPLDVTATLSTSKANEHQLLPIDENKSRAGLYASLGFVLVILLFGSLLYINRKKRTKVRKRYKRKT